MAERICPACNAVVPPRLKFCRGCGGRVDDAPAPDTDPAAAPDNSGDATMMSAMPRQPTAPAPTPPPGDSRDATVLGAFTARSYEMESPTIAPAGEPGPPATAPDPEWEQATMAPADADLDTTMANPPRFAPAPPPAPPPPNFLAEPDPDPDPVNDDLDGEGCDSGPTLLQPLPPLAVPGAPTRPPHRPSPRPAAAAAPAAGTVRLEHWSPKVKTAVVVLSKAETCVGRDRGDIQYPEDSHLSKKHARFLRDARGGLCVEDLGSLNGTYLRLRAPVKLEHRDVLFLGRHAFRFELLQYDDKDDRTIEGDPLTRVQGVQGKAPRARLVKRQAEGFRGLPFFFGTQRYVLGRTDGTHNFQKDDLMSRRHAALEFREGDYWLEDLGSQNGTYLRLRGPRPLESGDVVMMGDQYFKVP